ncbi:MAG: peptidylprolyl isomerase, partial [Planctomycetota bacterium]
MAKHHDTRGVPLPLPDPDEVRRSVAHAVSRIRERRGRYLLAAAGVLAAVVAVLVWRNLPSGEGTTEFASVWDLCEPIRSKLLADQSADAEIRALEARVERSRGQREEGYALWLAALYRYREAWTPEKVSLDQRRTHLEKALAHAAELKGERFDGLLVTKSGWFGPTPRSPLDTIHRQIEADLRWVQAHSIAQPAPPADRSVVLRTDLGDIHMRLYSDLAPLHVENFLTLVKQGTYNGTAFHYVLGGNQEPESVYGGDPFTFFYPDPLKEEHILRWNKGGLGYDVAPEESRRKVRHLRGIVSSQRVRQADFDNAVQFQILVAPNRLLDGDHSPFAAVVEGMDVVDKISRRQTADDHPVFKDDVDFSTVEARDLLVQPVLVHKAIVFKGGDAEDGHAFDLKEGERHLASLSATPAEPLPPDKIYCGRKLRGVDEAGEVRRGLDVPYPLDLD